MDWTKENDTKANSFNMIAQKYANDSKDNAGMKFMLPDKFLKSELIDATKNPNGLLSKEDYDLLTLNGLGVIGEQGDFNNLLIKSQVSAFQAHVDYRQGYTWKHPSNLGEYNIRVGGTGEPDYVTTIKLFDYDGKLVGEAENNVTGFGPFSPLHNITEKYKSSSYLPTICPGYFCPVTALIIVVPGGPAM